MILEDLSALDVETRPKKPTDKPYALEPWRVKQGLAEISCYSAAGKFKVQSDRDSDALDGGDRLRNTLLAYLSMAEGYHVIAHNALFDVAWILATVGLENYDLVQKVKWVDSSLLSKWLSNGQIAEGYPNFKTKLSHSLINTVNRYIPDHKWIKDFNDVKFQKVTPGENHAYWLKRNRLDTLMTLAVFKEMWKRFPVAQWNGFLIEQKCIAPIAKGWITGIPYDIEHIDGVHFRVETRKNELCKELGISVGCLTSPKQKQQLIFTTWGIKPGKLTPKGQPSTSHDVLMRLHQDTNDPRFDKLMAAIKLATIQSKYTNGFHRSREYVGEEVLYGSPRIFGTYTGRMTYSNKTTKKQEHQVSIAMHQLPRKAKAIKHGMKCPKGMGLIVVDANSQELRWMAVESGDEKLITGYQKGLDLHSDMTAAITGRSYEEVVEGNKNDVKEIVEDRQAGKLLNLSCQYRIGAAALAEKFFTTYEKDITESTSRSYLRAFKNQYPGVPIYWNDAINKAKLHGYSETVGGRRYKIAKFDWKGESSAINQPVQGSGADHTYATIGAIDDAFPFLTLALQLHDGLYYFCPLDILEKTAREIVILTRGSLYAHLFDRPFPIYFPFDGGFSTDSFATVKNF